MESLGKKMKIIIVVLSLIHMTYTVCIWTALTVLGELSNRALTPFSNVCIFLDWNMIIKVNRT